MDREKERPQRPRPPGLWDRGVRFGITDPFKSRHLVLVNPGPSGPTAREILDRMLRDG